MCLIRTGKDLTTIVLGRASGPLVFASQPSDPLDAPKLALIRDAREQRLAGLSRALECPPHHTMRPARPAYRVRRYMMESAYLATRSSALPLSASKTSRSSPISARFFSPY